MYHPGDYQRQPRPEPISTVSTQPHGLMRRFREWLRPELNRSQWLYLAAVLSGAGLSLFQGYLHDKQARAEAGADQNDPYQNAVRAQEEFEHRMNDYLQAVIEAEESGVNAPSINPFTTGTSTPPRE